MPKSDLHLAGPEYAPVADRIRLFYEAFPSGRIITKLVSKHNGEIVFRAEVYRAATDTLPAATGWASELEGDGDVNTVACLENTETSAIGRALANLGFTAAKQRPSAEEMAKAARVRARTSPPMRVGEEAHPSERRASAQPDDSAFGARQRQADAVSDFINLLRTGERVGLREHRAAVLGARALRGVLGLDAQSRLASRIRRWLVEAIQLHATDGSARLRG